MLAKKCFLLLTFAAAAFAQLPLRQDPKAVVASVDGRDITWGEVQEILAVAPPQLATYYKTNPQAALMQWFIMQELGRQGAERKLDEQSPLKEQLAALRMNYLADAYMNLEMNGYQVPAADVETFYKKNPKRFERVRVSGIYIKFKPEAKVGTTSTADIAAAAMGILQGAGVQRTEAQARGIAEDLIKRLNQGADMKTLVKEFSEDDATKAKDGDIGYVTGTSSLAPEVVKAALTLQAGAVSEPVKLPAGFYVLRAEARDLQPMSEVMAEIAEDIRKEHLATFMNGLNERFRPVIKDQTLLIQPIVK